MRTVVQRVSSAGVEVGGEVVAQIGRGLLALVGVERGDTAADAEWTAEKLAGLRIFGDEAGRMNRSVKDAGGGVLLVPNFTLAGDARKGRRPSFDNAMPPERAEPLFAELAAAVRSRGVPAAAGVFGARMSVRLVNDGPVTIVLESGARGAR